MAFDREELELAFQLHVGELVAAADRRTTAAEQRWLARHPSLDELEQRGLVDSHGASTPRAVEAAIEALAVLPGASSTDDKLRLLDACYRVAVVDREFRLGEGEVLLMASRLLGLSDDQFDRFLAERPSAIGMTVSVLERRE